MADLNREAIIKAYAEVEAIMKTAIENCSSKDQFIECLMHLQLTAQRTLGVLLFNAVKAAPSVSFEEQFERVTAGIRREFESLKEAEKEGPENMTAVDAEFLGENAIN